MLSIKALATTNKVCCAYMLREHTPKQYKNNISKGAGI
jgi:hypothetical protein